MPLDLPPSAVVAMLISLFIKFSVKRVGKLATIYLKPPAAFELYVSLALTIPEISQLSSGPIITSFD